MKKIKKLCCLLLVLALFAALVACAPGSQSSREEPGSEQTSTGEQVPEDPTVGEAPVLELVADPRHETGFNVKGQQDGDGTVKGMLWYDSRQEEALWDLAQWESGYYFRENGAYPAAYDILNGEKTESEGVWQWKDASKTLRVDPGSGSVFLALDAGKEYAAPRENGQPWPHLLLEYGLTENPRAAAMSRLELQLTFQLEHFENLMAEGTQREGLHTAQFMWYMTLRNVNPASEDYGCFMWFGVNLFDRRYEFAELYAMQDTGKPINTEAYIYQPAARDILPAATAVGVRQEVKADLLPHIKKAFISAQNAKFFTRSNFSDLAVGGGNFGWEMTGTYCAGMTVESFQLVAVMN